MIKILTSMWLLLGTSGLLVGQPPVGLWKTIHENTGEEKSYVEIYKKGDRYFGKIVEVLEDDYISHCHECEGDKHNQPVEGLVIIENVKATRSPRKWKGGTVLDPATGKTFRFSMWFEKGKRDELKVRGHHWTGVYRTQTWYRAGADDKL